MKKCPNIRVGLLNVNMDHQSDFCISKEKVRNAILFYAKDKSGELFEELGL